MTGTPRPPTPIQAGAQPGAQAAGVPGPRPAPGRRPRRAERSAANKAAWAERVSELQQAFFDASPANGAGREERREARRTRQQARAARDLLWRQDAARILAASTGSDQQSAAAALTAPVRRSSAARRAALAIEGGIEATWDQRRPLTRAERSTVNKTAWAQLQLERLADTAAARTSRRGARRQAHSQAWLAAQAARIQSALPTTPTAVPARPAPRGRTTP